MTFRNLSSGSRLRVPVSGTARGTGLVGLLLLLPVAASCAASSRTPRPDPPSLQASSRPGPGPWQFVDVAREKGIDFTHFIGATGQFYFQEIMGPGCALLDYDNDGDLDVLLLQGTITEPGKSWSDAIFPYDGPLPPRTSLYRNELISAGGGGELKFTDVTPQSGIGQNGYAMGVATGDYDNDGDVDVYITNFGPDVLMRNNGDGTFTDVTAGAGLGDPRWGASATFLDYDNDGYLDLFVVAYCDFTIATHKQCFMESGARDYCGPKAYLSVPARLYRNRGDGTFSDVTEDAGVDISYGHGLGAVAGDFDENGWMDLFVANDSDANQLWVNEGGGFTDRALLHGAAYNEHGIPAAGMGIAIGDYDEDGDLDLFVTNLIGETNTLFQNRGDGTFEDVTDQRGLGPPSLGLTGFGVGWFDADNDGDLDLFIVNGDVRLYEPQLGEPFPFRQPNQIMIRDSHGNYTDESEALGPGLALWEVSRGAAFGDVDNDGDVDLLVSNDNGPARLLLNELPDRRSWVQLRVLDESLGRDAFGAKVRFAFRGGRVLTRYVRTDGSYLSASDPRVHLAWPQQQELLRAEIVTLDGRVLPLGELELNAISTVLVGPSGASIRRGF